MVLEIGSGDQPFLCSDVLCDLFVADDTERVGQIVIDRPFVVGDIYNLPFKDDAFEFVICHHVLEHLDDPELAASELSRVAKAGSVRVPTKVSEKLTGSIYHVWMITDRGSDLLFEAKKRPVFDEDIKAFMKGEIMSGGDYARFYSRHRLKLEVQHIWQNQLKVMAGELPADRIDGGFSQSNQDAEIYWQDLKLDQAHARGLKDRLRSMVSLLLRRLRRAPIHTIGNTLRCPNCQSSDVSQSGDGVECSSCGAHYPKQGKSPVLIVEAIREDNRRKSK